MKNSLTVTGVFIALSAVVIAVFVVDVGGTKTYENTNLGISFSYPQSWGEVRQENIFQDVNLQIVLSFEKMPDARFITFTRNYAYPALSEGDAIYYYLSYSPQSPTEFCSERKKTCDSNNNSSCFAFIENHCGDTPPHVFYVSKLAKQNDGRVGQMRKYLRKYKTLEKNAVITIFDQHFFALQGETFRPLTLQVDLQPMERDTFCLSERSGENEEKHDCMNEKDLQEVSDAIRHFPQSSLGKNINKVIHSMKIFPPTEQESWYKNIFRNHNGEEGVSSNVLDSLETYSSETDNEALMPKENSTVIVSPPDDDPILKTAKSITVEGVAGAKVQSMTVYHTCESYIDLKNAMMTRPDKNDDEWKWSYTISEGEMCQGQNLLTFVPSTCDPTSKNRCALSSRFSFISDVATLHPKSLQLISPLDDDTATTEATELVFKGIAGSEVGRITITTGAHCVSGEVRKQQSTVIERPANVDGQWNWDFSMKSDPDGICRGFNFVDFRPDTCSSQYYDSTCGLREKFEFLSHAGYLAPTGLVMFRLGSHSDTSDLKDAQTITLRGAAGSEVNSISVHRECTDVSVYADDSIQKTTDVLPDGSWEWSYNLSVGSNTICRGNNDISFSSEDSDMRAGLGFQSNVGFLPADMQLEIERILKYKTGKVKEVENDTDVMVALKNPIPYNQEYCFDPELSEVKNLKSSPKVKGETVVLDDHFSVRLIWNENKRVPAVEFMRISDIGDFVTPPQINGLSCEFSSKEGADVYFLRPDRIIVNFGSYHESTSSEMFIWDGKEWKSLRSFVPVVNNPVLLGPVNKDAFVLQEVVGRLCCGDTAYPVIPGKSSAFVLDVSTLEIIDVHMKDVRI